MCIYEKGKTMKSCKEDAVLISHIKRFITLNPCTENDTIWCDIEENKYFSPSLFRGGYTGKEHSFCAPNPGFLNSIWGAPFVKKNIEKYDMQHFKKQPIVYDEECIYSKPEFLEKYKDSSILIISGGPSTKDTDWQNIKTDYIWSCNNFFLDPKFEDVDVDLITLAPSVDFLNNEKLENYIKKKNTKVAFEIERGDFSRDYRNMNDFVNEHPDICSFFHCRYRGAPGVSLRMIRFAIMLGAKDIYFVGVDGFKENSSGHAFEKDKANPNWFQTYGPRFQDRQFVSFWNYILELKDQYNFNLYNLGEGHKFNVSTEISVKNFPLSEDIVQKLNLSNMGIHEFHEYNSLGWDATQVDAELHLQTTQRFHPPGLFEKVSSDGTVGNYDPNRSTTKAEK